VTGIQGQGRTATILLRGSNKLVLEEAERSLHDALCVIRCLVQKRALIPGGAAPEMEVEHQLIQWAKTLQVPENCQLSAVMPARPSRLCDACTLTPLVMAADCCEQSRCATCGEPIRRAWRVSAFGLLPRRWRSSRTRWQRMPG